MSRLRFNHVFVPLMGLSLVSAFVVPARFTDRLRGIQGVFSPVSRPVRALALWFEGKFETPVDQRPDKDIRDENERLKASLAHLTGQVESLQKMAADRRRLGDLGELCIPAQVMGADAAGRESLSLHGVFDQAFVGRKVLHVAGLVGQIERAGPGGAQVRLLTDPGFRVAARFARLQPGEDGDLVLVPIQTTSVLVEGIGKGKMEIQNLQMKEAKDKEIAAGDMVVLDDPEWPEPLRFQAIGQVVSVAPRRDAALLAHVVVQPRRTLTKLPQVMIMVREDAGFRTAAGQ
jgi:cell shape-determining protein MreC